jgi:hypothetical protein
VGQIAKKGFIYARQYLDETITVWEEMMVQKHVERLIREE